MLLFTLFRQVLFVILCKYFFDSERLFKWFKCLLYVCIFNLTLGDLCITKLKSCCQKLFMDISYLIIISGGFRSWKIFESQFGSVPIFHFSPITDFFLSFTNMSKGDFVQKKGGTEIFIMFRVIVDKNPYQWRVKAIRSDLFYSVLCHLSPTFYCCIITNQHAKWQSWMPYGINIEGVRNY